jgi:hypothetical protein
MTFAFSTKNTAQPFEYQKLGLGNETLKGTYKFRQYVSSAVSDRYASKTKPDVPDMLPHFIEAKDRDGTPHSFLGGS